MTDFGLGDEVINDEKRAAAVALHFGKHTEVTMPARTKIDQARVKQLLAQGVMQKHIAIRLGVSKGCISRIVSGKSTRKEA